MYQPRDQFQPREKYGFEFGGTTLSAERVFDILRRQWPLIVAITGCALVLVFLYLLTATPMYTANARILMDTRQTQVLDKASAVPNALIDPGYVHSQLDTTTPSPLLLPITRP